MHIHCFVYMDFKYIFHLCTRYIAYSSFGNAKHLLRRGKVNIKRKGIGKDSQVSPMNFKSNN